jgi:hypothetical protein
MNAHDAAVAMCQRDLRARNLSSRGFTAHLPHRFKHMKQSATDAGMAERHEPSMSRYRQRTAALDPPFHDEGTSFSFGAESEVFEFDQDGDREAVVNLGDVYIRWC